MRRVLLTAVAVAPLLALASVAEAACPAAGTATAGSDITVASGCTVTPKANGDGLILNSSNNITVVAGGTITNTDASNSVGILVQGGNSGNVDNQGSISLLMSYTPTVEGNTGIAGGPFATGTNRVGIDVINGALNGNITNESTGVITIQGDASTGIFIEKTASLTGNLIDNGAISVTGNNTVGINVAGGVGGNVTVGSAISANGVGTQGLVTSAAIGGQLTIDSSISATGYRSTTAPTVQAVLNQLGKDQLQQGGSAVVVGGSVANGIAISAAITTGSGTSATTTPAASVSVFGSAPAMVIGAAGQNITVGNNTGQAYGLIVGGTVEGAGVYDQQTTPNLPAPASATAIRIGAAGGTVNLSGGIHVSGSVDATALNAAATGINILSGVSAQQILNDGQISASVTASTPQTADALIIASGSHIGSIVNTGTIAAVISDTASVSGNQA
ncbi:MAG TPA: hypothetical protein VHS81_03595, partial [Caulobacteraceae bacterium]|nr:hypothetical protein [Caulobacteraceae bacterium]